ncbi:uncharacterized protein LOC141620310 [Silene latifolia]|uniref:uncharacterized protein LOC141620310 n=1 Tax=Silene latifolia TaxID=37657 RepID=UPI003D777AEC
MDFHVKEGGKEWRVTGFYGWPSVSDRHLSWALLRLLHGQSSLPWICIGDFNEILYSTEMKGGSRAQWKMNNFQAAIDDCGLKDMAWEGYAYTFDNGQAGDANRQCLLDRTLCSESWLDLFPYAKLFHLDREWSDHAPIRLAFDRREIGGKTRTRFRFEQVWISIGKINRSLENKRRQLTRLNEGPRTEENVKKRRKRIAEIASLHKQEEQYWRQRSRALWLKDEDHNTKFFHSRAGERKKKNFIGRLVDDGGRKCIGNDEVARGANCYFQELFTSAEPSSFDDVLVSLDGRVTERMNRFLRAEYGEAEITKALNQMHPLKAPGPDGMNGLFYQTYWQDIGPNVEADVINTILQRYVVASGQLVNLEKTTVSFSRGVRAAQRTMVANRLGVTEVEDHARYLGLPTVIGRSKKVITDIIRDKLCKRLQGWRWNVV